MTMTPQDHEAAALASMVDADLRDVSDVLMGHEDWEVLFPALDRLGTLDQHPNHKVPVDSHVLAVIARRMFLLEEEQDDE